MKIPSGTLQTGSHGKLVEDLQKELTEAGFSTGGIDGSFGPQTKAALEQFQRAKNLPVDGVAGQQTWTALGGDRFDSASPSATNAPTPSSNSDGSKQVTGYQNGRAVTITVVPVGNGKFLQPKAAAAFQNMMEAATRAGHNLYANSGFRTFGEQQALFNQYGPGRAARPGFSNHEMGIAMDIGGVGGFGTSSYNWLKANGPKFGFYGDVPGEFWHFDFKG